MDRCPCCGYCPHCGRRDAAPVIPILAYPVYPTYPWWVQPTITYTANQVTARTDTTLVNGLPSAVAVRLMPDE